MARARASSSSGHATSSVAGSCYGERVATTLALTTGSSGGGRRLARKGNAVQGYFRPGQTGRISPKFDPFGPNPKSLCPLRHPPATAATHRLLAPLCLTRRGHPLPHPIPCRAHPNSTLRCAGHPLPHPHPPCPLRPWRAPRHHYPSDTRRRSPPVP
jgi:hypothetical protein